MAYADQKMSGSRIVAIAIVALIHVALGYAFVTGLAYQYVKKAAEKLNTFDVQEPPPPPPDKPPPPPPEQKFTPPPVVSPPPIVAVPSPAPPVVTVPTAPPIVITPTAPPAPPAPPKISQRAGPKGNPGQYFTKDYYPPAALRAGAEGRVVAQLTIGADGRVTDCRVTSSSGNADLDDQTCRTSRSRLKFTPAKDENGNAVASNYALSVRWTISDE